MKRIKSACLLQTIHFQLSDKLEHEAAVVAVREEFEQYKKRLEQAHTKYQVLDETEQPDGSFIVHIKKQYNKQNCDEYMK